MAPLCTGNDWVVVLIVQPPLSLDLALSFPFSFPFSFSSEAEGAISLV